MTCPAGSRPPVVAPACPAGRPSRYVVARSSRHAARTSGPPRRWIAPSTPPPPSIAELAALTTASTACSVMSPRTRVISTPFPSRLNMIAKVGSRARSVPEPDAQPSVRLALVLHLDDVDAADLPGGRDVRTPVGLRVQTDDFDDPDVGQIRRQQVGRRSDCLLYTSP